MASLENGLIELLPTLRSLSRADKLLLIQHLAAELARDEGIALLEPGTAYTVWTPLEAFDTAAVLLEVLNAEGNAS